MKEELVQGVCAQYDLALRRKVGAGAFKHVFLVENDVGLLALKLSEPSSGGISLRLDREIHALKGCDHPAIATVYWAEELIIDGVACVAILEEYLPHGTLSQKFTAGVSVDELRELGAHLVSALAHLEERKYVHRDIKPDNILFRTPSEPVLTDFGLVRVLNDISLTQDYLGQGPGTPLYSAPEQLLNDKHAIDWRTDQFGLAVVLAEGILGRHPFQSDGMSKHDAVIAVQNRAPLPKVNANALCKAGLACLVKALSPWSVGRYRTPEQFRSALLGKE